jgi:diguanylate cyclase (GGDEF)-like protein
VAVDGPFPEAPGSGADDAGRQTLADGDQTASDGDQTSADFDQTFSDLDQSASDRDQQASDRDQQAADRDQADADRLQQHTGIESGWEDTRRTRSQTTIDRDISSHARRESSRARDVVAESRDKVAEVRDATARRRDELAAALDVEMAHRERIDTADANGALLPLQQAFRDRRAAAATRERSAQARDAAASERAAAGLDRDRAADDRRAAEAERSLEGVDRLTGALRRSGGLDLLRRELARTRRANESLMVAFIDVDGLQAFNDERGHAEGDELLRGIVRCLTRVLRSYDVIMRFGGDEFVCVVCGENLSGFRERFAQAGAELAKRHGARITVGLVEAGTEERPEQLIARAEQAMVATRRERAAAAHSGIQPSSCPSAVSSSSK